MEANAPNLIASILKSKCPRCRQGNLFLHHPYNIKKVYSMPKKCTNCGQSTCPEPLFYDGSMFVSYAFSVANIMGVFIGFNVLFERPDVTWMIIFSIVIAILFGPMSLRLSRTIWIYLFVKYDKVAINNFKNAQKTAEIAS